MEFTNPTRFTVKLLCATLLATGAVWSHATFVDYTDESDYALKESPSWVGFGTRVLYTSTSDASDNLIVVDYSSGTKTDPTDVIGGIAYQAPSSIAQNNEVHIYNSGFINRIFGGHSTGKAFNEGDSVLADSSSNRVFIHKGTFNQITGGYASASGFGYIHATASDNHIEIEKVEISGTLQGGYAFGYAHDNLGKPNDYNTVVNANNNSILIKDGNFNGKVIGGNSSSNGSGNGYDALNASNNVITVHRGEFADDIIGGTSFSSYSLSTPVLGEANANANTISLHGGSFQGNLFGGEAVAVLKASSNHNTINIGVNDQDNPVIYGDVYGGYATLLGIYSNYPVEHSTVQAIGNTVNIKGSPSIHGSIYGGFLENDSVSAKVTADVFSGNTLNFNARPISIVNMGGFENYNFVLPSYVRDSVTMIEASGTVEVSDPLTGTPSKVTITGIATGTPLVSGDEITLIDAKSGMIGQAELKNTTVQQGISLVYDVSLKQEEDRIMAVIGLDDAPSIEMPFPSQPPSFSARVNPQLSAVFAGRTATLSMANQGAELISDVGAKLRHAEPGHWHSFVNIAGASSRYKTDHHIDIKGVQAILGTAYRLDKTSVGFFVEGGQGNYDSDGRFANALNVSGEGHAKYYGVGLIGQHQFDNGIYITGALRAGKTDSDYHSFGLISPEGLFARYDSTSNYYGAQAGMSYVYPLSTDTQLEFTGEYLWTHLDADSMNIAGDPIDFDAINSHRVKLGTKVFHEMNPQFTLMAGIGYEHEFSGEAKGTTYHVYKMNPSNLKGSTGSAEIGFRMTPTANQSFNLETKLSGFIGQRRGISGTLQARYMF